MIFNAGSNAFGQLGDGSEEDSKDPKKVEALHTEFVKSVSCGAHCTAAIAEPRENDGKTSFSRLWVWGQNQGSNYPRLFWGAFSPNTRFYVVKPCPKEMKCDVEVDSYAVRDVEEYRNFCDRPKSQRPQAEEVIRDVAEHLTTVYLSRCERGKRCLYEGSTPPGGFPNSWNGATHCTSELTINRNGEIHCWDRAYDDEENQVWGVKQGPYEFKPATTSSSNGSFLPLDFSSISSDKKLDDKSFVDAP